MIEITGLFVALSHAVTTAKAAIQARDEAKRREALSELMEALADLQAKHLTVIQNQQALIEENEALKKQLAAYDTWEQEKARYLLRQLSSGGFVYILNPSLQNNETPHWLCPNCYHECHKSILQMEVSQSGIQLWTCPKCKSKIISRGDWPTSLK